jgi:hypothetical protein
VDVGTFEAYALLAITFSSPAAPAAPCITQHHKSSAHEFFIIMKIEVCQMPIADLP